jgi:small basic protein (TIGR04137 family)
MTVHKSLKLKDSLTRARGVLSRGERLALLKERGLWRDGQSIYGLRKTRVAVVKKK